MEGASDTPIYRPGSPEDFDRLYRAAYPRLKRTLTAILGDPDSAEDCVQEAFVRAFKAWKDWRPDAPAEAWLHRIAINRALTYRRKRALQEIGEVVRRFGRPEPPPDPADSLEWAELKRALARLPTRLSATIVLRHYHGYSNREIAFVFGISERAVGMRILEARTRLRERLGGTREPALPTSSRRRVMSGEGGS
jgi:RNA polymerase sigma-70 factor (ECF subfamily)